MYNKDNDGLRKEKLIYNEVAKDTYNAIKNRVKRAVNKTEDIDIILYLLSEIDYYREKIGKLTDANNTQNEPTPILEDKTMLIIDTYKINNKEYSISYTDETKAKDLFDCLNRIVINNNGMVTYKDICIRVKEPIIGVVAIEKRKGLGSWFTG